MRKHYEAAKCVYFILHTLYVDYKYKYYWYAFYFRLHFRLLWVRLYTQLFCLSYREVPH